MTRPNYIFGVAPKMGSVLSIGSFDGLHLGHQSILNQVISLSDRLKLPSIVASFDPHPREVLSQDYPHLLSPGSEKTALLESFSIDAFGLIPFTKMMSFVEPEEFVEHVLVKHMLTKAVVVGYDHRFGRNRRGDFDMLCRLGKQFDFEVHECEAVSDADLPISSSRIRTLLQQGTVDEAAHQLGRRYSIGGEIIRGAGRGRTLGVPTANLIPDHERKLVPLSGVYAVKVDVPHLKGRFDGMMNIGTRPTFDGKSGIHLEVHLFDFDDDLYDRELRVEFHERVRDEQRFSFKEALIAQLKLDSERCRRSLSGIS